MSLSISRRRVRRGAAALLLVLAGCATDEPTAPEASTRLLRSGADPLAAEIRQLAVGRGIIPLDRPASVRKQLVELGRVLAFDKELSGNRDISCMTCHLPGLATGDARSLSIGQGATGLGPDRTHPDGVFIPRNAPALFNLHALELLFWDGRVSRDAAGQIHTPAGAKVAPGMRQVFEFGALSALPLFPVLSRSEMRSDGQTNELSAIADDQEPQVWAALMTRLGRIREYRRLFEAARAREAAAFLCAMTRRAPGAIPTASP